MRLTDSEMRAWRLRGQDTDAIRLYDDIVIMSRKQTLILVLIFAGSAFVLRLLPHPWNFTPLGALALSAGFWLPKRYIGLPLAVRFFSDLIIGFFTWQIMLAVYA